MKTLDVITMPRRLSTTMTLAELQKARRNAETIREMAEAAVSIYNDAIKATVGRIGT